MRRFVGESLAWAAAVAFAVALFLSVVWAVWGDHTREWNDHCENGYAHSHTNPDAGATPIPESSDLGDGNTESYTYVHCHKGGGATTTTTGATGVAIEAPETAQGGPTPTPTPKPSATATPGATATPVTRMHDGNCEAKSALTGWAYVPCDEHARLYAESETKREWEEYKRNKAAHDVYQECLNSREDGVRGYCLR